MSRQASENTSSDNTVKKKPVKRKRYTDNTDDNACEASRTLLEKGAPNSTKKLNVSLRKLSLLKIPGDSSDEESSSSEDSWGEEEVRAQTTTPSCSAFFRTSFRPISTNTNPTPYVDSNRGTSPLRLSEDSSLSETEANSAAAP